MLYLFDIDGTILLTGGAGSVALNEVFSDMYNVDGAMDRVSPGGKTDPKIIAEIFADHMQREPLESEIAQVLEQYLPVLRREIAASRNFRIMPHVHQTLDFLGDAQNVMLGIATGNVRHAAQAKLEFIDLWDRFSIGGFGDDSPDRAELVACAITRAEEQAGHPIERKKIVVVGDTPRDVSAAHACGILCIAVCTGRPSRSPPGARHRRPSARRCRDALRPRRLPHP